MAYGSLLADVVQSSTSGPVTFQNTSGTQVGTLCRAWVQFNSSGAIGGSGAGAFNVSSVTKNSTGNYSVNFTTAMIDTNYAVHVSSGWVTGQPSCFGGVMDTATTSLVRVQILNNSDVATDTSLLNYVAIHR